jgi:hypothetical protein
LLRLSGTGVKKESLVDIEIVARDMSSGGTGHEHITTLYWVEPPGTAPVKPSDRSTIVSWLEAGRGRAYVEHPHIEVHVITPRHGEKYLQTYADGRPTNNLLNLPTGAQLAARR